MSEASSPKTTFAGQSNPNGNGRLPEWAPQMAIFVVAFLVCPVVPVTYLLVMMAFVRFRVAPRSIGQVLAGYTVLWLGYVLFFDANFGRTFLTMPREVIAAARGKNPGQQLSEAAGDWPYWLVTQIPTGILIGLLVGWAMAAWKFKYRTPEWSRIQLRRTPLQIVARRRMLPHVANGTFQPSDGLTIGVLPNGQAVVQSDVEAGMHTSVTGQVGSGKTTALLIRTRDVIRRGMPLIFIDMKGSPDVANELYGQANAHGRRLWHFVIDPATYRGPSPYGPAFYDPAGHGDYTRRKDLLMGAWLFQEEFYKTEVENYLQLAFKADMLTNASSEEPTFARVSRLLVPAYLKQMVEANLHLWETTEHLQLDRMKLLELTGDMSRECKSAIGGMSNKVQIIRSSVAGPAVCADPTGRNTINLYDVCQSGDVVLFSLDAPQYPQLAQLLGRLVVQDLKTLESELRHHPVAAATHFMVDEYSKLGAENVLSLLSTCRDANMSGTLATQGLADLRAVSEEFCDQLMGLMNCHIVLSTATHTDATYYAGLTGTERQYQEAYDIEMRSSMFSSIGVGSATGAGRVDVVEDFRIKPSTFQDLPTLTAVYLANNPVRRQLYPVTIVRDESSKPTAAAVPAHGDVDRPELPNVGHDRVPRQNEPLVDVRDSVPTHVTRQHLVPNSATTESADADDHTDDGRVHQVAVLPEVLMEGWADPSPAVTLRTGTLPAPVDETPEEQETPSTQTERPHAAGPARRPMRPMRRPGR